MVVTDSLPANLGPSPLTTTATLEALLAVMVSVSLAAAVAVFIRVPACVAAPWIVIVTVAPFSIVPIVQVTVVVPLHVPIGFGLF